VGSSHAVWMPGIYTDFIFTPRLGTWSAGGDTATLTGTIRRRDDWGSGFEITVNLAGKTTATNAAQPPHFDLDPGAYIWNGGPVDPSTWCYYEQFNGVFTGFGQYQGAVLDIARRGPAWQMGVGANNKNANYGASAWFTWTLRSPFGSLPLSGVGDFNIDITDCTPPTLCVKQAVSDKWNNGGSRHAVWMPGIYEKFIFNPQFGSWTASNDVATLRGTIRREDDLTSGFHILVHLSRKTNSPDSEPHLALDPDAYIWNGGPIDPSTWVYYEEFDGDFTGFGRYQGAMLHINRHGPAWQMGVGANNKNANYGAAAWFTWSQTTQFGSLPASGIGDFNLDIFECYPATLGDFVWLDGNANGQQDADEPGLPEVNIQLLGCSSTVVLLSTNTDSTGNYAFTGLMAGSYRIKVGLRDGLLVTPAQNVGNDATDSDVSPTTLMSGCVSLTNTLAGSTNRTVDVGLVPPAGPAPAPRLLGVQASVQGQTILSLQGARYRKYAIEMTDSPGKGWEPGGTAWNLNGTLRFSDPTPLPSCLYRVKLLP
jgi:hypothetical protein